MHFFNRYGKATDTVMPTALTSRIPCIADDDGLAKLEGALCNTKALSSIVLARTDLTDCCAPVLERLVEFVPKLQHLDVSWNHLGPSAATALAKGLNPGKPLLLSDCCLCSSVCTSLLQVGIPECCYFTTGSCRSHLKRCSCPIIGCKIA